MEVAKIPACARWWANAICVVDFGGGRSLGCKVERKVRTPKGRIPCENGGAVGKPSVTDSVTENIPPRAFLRIVRGKGEKGR